MKKFTLSLMLMLAAWMGANAMSFERARAEALYLTDKMAYELNLNDQQYNDAYEINFDYFLRIGSPSDLYGVYYNHRLSDFRCILHDWQFSLLMAADYFLRPLVWRAGSWYFPIYSYYNRGYYYYNRPSVWISYRGGHSRYHHHGGFYADRRPHWNGGFRGHDMHRPSHDVGGHAGGHRINGNGYHIDMSGHNSGGGRPGGSNHNGGGNNHSRDMNHGGGNHSGSGNHDGGHQNGGGMNPGGHGNSGNHGNPGVGSHNNSPKGGFSSSHSKGSSYGSSSHGSQRGSVNRGNSFDGSSSRANVGSYGSSSHGSPRGGGSSMGSSRSGGFSGSHSGGGRGERR